MPCLSYIPLASCFQELSTEPSRLVGKLHIKIKKSHSSKVFVKLNHSLKGFHGTWWFSKSQTTSSYLFFLISSLLHIFSFTFSFLAYLKHFPLYCEGFIDDCGVGLRLIYCCTHKRAVVLVIMSY